MGRTSCTSAMNQIFLRSALSRSSRLAMGPVRTSRAFTDPAVLAFLASLDLGVSAWTLYIARACDWELGIITAISMCHLVNVFNCLLDILYELFSSGPTKDSTAGMNAGIGSFSSSGYYWHFGSCKSRVTLFLTLSFLRSLRPDRLLFFGLLQLGFGNFSLCYFFSFSTLECFISFSCFSVLQLLAPTLFCFWPSAQFDPAS